MDTRVNVPTRPQTPKEAELKEWLAFASAELSARWNELLPALLLNARFHPAINDGDDETAGIFTENLRMVNALRSSAVDFHQTEKAPYWQLGKLVDGWFNTFTDNIDRTVEPLRSALRDFTIRKNAEKIFEDKEPVRGVYGSTASVKETWDYIVEDITKVPVEYLMENPKLVKAVMADRDPKTRVPRKNIPGIRWVKKQSLAVS